jgi:hypothetical protein
VCAACAVYIYPSPDRCEDRPGEARRLAPTTAHRLICAAPTAARRLICAAPTAARRLSCAAPTAARWLISVLDESQKFKLVFPPAIGRATSPSAVSRASERVRDQQVCRQKVYCTKTNKYILYEPPRPRKSVPHTRERHTYQSCRARHIDQSCLTPWIGHAAHHGSAGVPLFVAQWGTREVRVARLEMFFFPNTVHTPHAFSYTGSIPN